ncbi:hypothetical protein IHN63_00255 [Deinococcus sp. 6YEL10]|uniref:hypothetical protein n=1 Tax=Deinococcus sp. 6YEL10 TaxID=2745870 RepID=UPI001E4E0E8C|nr:hypothetical protein [Deinococcus sp. 6YEL10]MCD0159730.1 hypothetical protein [Deinococcus sp. 6YEL10]
MTTRLLSIDPSTSGAAYTVLDHDPVTDQFTLIEKGELVTVTSYLHAAQQVTALHQRHGFTVVALETPAHFVGSAAKFTHLIAMSLILGALACGVPQGVTTYLLPANARGNALTGGWRPYLLGVARPARGVTWDALVADYYRTQPPVGWPERSNGHVRDAGMVGMALARAVAAGDPLLTGASEGLFGAHKVTEQRAAAARERNKGRVKDPVKTRKGRTRRTSARTAAR